MSLNPVEIRKVAEESVRLAGSFLRLMSIDNIQLYQRGGMLYSNFDVEADRLIRNRIAMSYPDHKLVTDYSHSDTDEATIVWYCDPLDGTKAFIRGQYAFVSLSAAAVDKEGIIASSIYNPFTDVLYSSSRTEGVYVNEKQIQRPEDIRLIYARVLIDFSRDIPVYFQRRLATGDLSGDIGRIFRFDGSIAQHLALIAQGTLDGAILWGSGNKGNYWDIAGAFLLLEKLGFMCTDLRGDKITQNHPGFDQIAIGQPKLHKDMLDFINAIIETLPD